MSYMKIDLICMRSVYKAPKAISSSGIYCSLCTDGSGKIYHGFESAEKF